MEHEEIKLISDRKKNSQNKKVDDYELKNVDNKTYRHRDKISDKIS